MWKWSRSQLMKISSCFCLCRPFFMILAAVSSRLAAAGGPRWESVSVCTYLDSPGTNSSEVGFDLACSLPGDRLVIGWSHYGVYRTKSPATPQQLRRCNPMPNDCITEHTEKVAELCTGHGKCVVSSRPQFVHKCSKYSHYLYISYKCIPAEVTEQICSSANIIANDVFLSSNNFPEDYPKARKCACDVTAGPHSRLHIESLAFNTQEENDVVTVENGRTEPRIYSGSLPIGSILLSSEVSAQVSFHSNGDVSASGFLLSITALSRCPTRYDGIGDICLRKVSSSVTWFDGAKRCEAEGDKLLQWPSDINQARQLVHWFGRSGFGEIWLANTFRKSESQPSWPLIPSTRHRTGKCLALGTDGPYFTGCHNNKTVFCQRQEEAEQLPVNLQCNVSPKSRSNAFRLLSGSRKNGKTFVITKYSEQQKRLAIVQALLFWLLCACILLVSLNLIICVTCYHKAILWSVKRACQPSKCSEKNEEYPPLNEITNGTINANDRECVCCPQRYLSQQRLRVSLLLAPEQHLYESITAKQRCASQPGECQCCCCCHCQSLLLEKQKEPTNTALSESGYSSGNRAV